MNLATRCSACGTIFRVVQDQLKVSEGWVRCGRCDDVFNAVEALFDLDSESPPPWTPPPPVAHAAPSLDADTVQQATPPYDEREVAELDEDDRIASRFFQPDHFGSGRSPADSVSQRDRVDFADAKFNDSLLDDDDDDPAATATPLAPMQDNTPGFVRHAEERERSRRPLARVMVAVGCLMLVATLAVQVAHHFRDTFAARWPITRAPLAGWCVLAGCSLQAPRRLEDVQVENTTLSRATVGTDTFRLAVTLRNRGTLPVALPAIEVTLTDGNGQMVSRKALSPADFRRTDGAAIGQAIAPNTEAPLQVLLATGTSRVSGYTVEVFYP